ncbi:MAG TPA: hypothetical protein VG841_14365 [Caulobacterales bacterium]|nr:hypothetical protein [Caulobacterales bacterium]
MSSGRPSTVYENLQSHAGLAWYPISISVIMFCLFSTFGLAAGQVQEALSNYVGDRTHPWAEFAWGRVAITFLAIFVFASTLRYWTARLLDQDLRNVHTLSALTVWQRAFMGIAWYAPWIGAALSFVDAELALSGAQAEPDRNFAQDLVDLSASLVQHPLQTPFTLLAAAALALPVLFVAAWWSPLYRLAHGLVGRWTVARAIHDWALPAIFFALTALFLFMPAPAIRLARETGPIPLICVSFAVITAAGSYLIDFGRRHGLPAFALAALAPMVVGAIGLDDNHFIRQRGPMQTVERPSLPEALRRFETAGRASDPIILVSSEGGGIRSAHFTATILARFADQCPRLARRIFLISAVSGGAVGAAAYRASLEAAPLAGDACDLSITRPAGAREKALAGMFSRDHLSPVIAKEMFPELIQTFFPASLPNSAAAFLPQTDRQLGFELSLEQAFASSFHIDPARSAFSGSMFGGPGREPAAPHLLINMTEVSSGSVFVASPLDLADLRERYNWLHDFRCLWSAPQEKTEAPRCNQSPDYRLSTMAATSARFPLISPAGSVRAQNATFRFVDGGYFDNSGVETLLGVIDHLRRDARASGGAAPPIAVLHIDSNPYRQRLPVKWRLDFDIHELQAVLATREERVRISLSKLTNMYQDRSICSLRFVEVSEDRVPLRLGWILSHTAANALEAQAASQLAAAFPGERPPICDGDGSSEMHEATDRYAERLALGPVGGP